ncbi:MAG TPA: DNA cytosine methyltransferase [Anaerolineales bacterium]|jgi:DNA (cytosine-5)-methyltransferase 1|nr:DNA cytosine methyltransferase [Anaerolineales bacterium]HQX17570.1 DNA cytosine methyltransferase [Anaerolineales bacterium]
MPGKIKDALPPKALSLFSGAGGMDIGVKQVGFDILACVEFDPYACETLRTNISQEHLHTKVFEEDVRKIDPAVMMKDLGLKAGELDLLCGGPPCQAFSQIGKRHSIKDERGLLLFEMVRFAEVFKPRSILIEQVKGLLSAKDENDKVGGVFDHLISRLENLGYVPKWKVVNAAEYGVPQLRQRVFIVATLKPNGFQFPAPTHGSPKKATPLFSLPPFVTVGDVIMDLGKPYKQNGFIPENSHLDVTPDGDRFRMNGVPEGSHLSAQTHLPKEQLRNLTKKDTTKFKRLSRQEPSNTLRCGEIFFHPKENRYLTPREYMRIHGYPDSYILRGPIRGRSGRVRHLDQHRQIANSVPPPIARLLAEEVLKVLNAKNI